MKFVTFWCINDLINQPIKALKRNFLSLHLSSIVAFEVQPQYESLDPDLKRVGIALKNQLEAICNEVRQKMALQCTAQLISYFRKSPRS